MSAPRKPYPRAFLIVADVLADEIEKRYAAAAARWRKAKRGRGPNKLLKVAAESGAATELERLLIAIRKEQKAMRLLQMPIEGRA